MERFPSWPKGADCKSAGSAFGGSNPPLSTIIVNRGQEVVRMFGRQQSAQENQKFLIPASDIITHI